MGWMTVISVHNDCMHDFEKDPAAFGKAILASIEVANSNNGLPVDHIMSGVKVHPSFHVSSDQLFIATGNGFYQLGYSSDWARICKRNRDFAKDALDRIVNLVKYCKDQFKATPKD